MAPVGASMTQAAVPLKKSTTATDGILAQPYWGREGGFCVPPIGPAERALSPSPDLAEFRAAKR